MNISLCSACMNRESLLEEALSTWVKLPFSEIIIVDWSSKIPLNNLINKYQNGKIFLIRVDGKEKYNQSKASNLKVRFSTSEYVLSIDSDIKLSTKFLDLNIEEKSFFSGNHKDHPGTVGTCLVSRKMFDNINGYNELMEGWGQHDYDFYNRLKEYGYKESFFNACDITHIDHDEISRTENYDIKNKLFSRSLNKKIAIKNPWGIHSKMELHEASIYYPDGKIETKTI